jgi:WD40 repeat protein
MNPNDDDHTNNNNNDDDKDANNNPPPSFDRQLSEQGRTLLREVLSQDTNTTTLLVLSQLTSYLTEDGVFPLDVAEMVANELVINLHLVQIFPDDFLNITETQLSEIHSLGRIVKRGIMNKIQSLNIKFRNTQQQQQTTNTSTTTTTTRNCKSTAKPLTKSALLCTLDVKPLRNLTCFTLCRHSSSSSSSSTESQDEWYIYAGSSQLTDGLTVWKCTENQFDYSLNRIQPFHTILSVQTSFKYLDSFNYSMIGQQEKPSLIAAITNQGIIYIFNVQTMKPIMTSIQAPNVGPICFSPSGKYVVVGTMGETNNTNNPQLLLKKKYLLWYDLENNGSLSMQSRGHSNDITALRRYKEFIISASSDGSCRIWLEPSVQKSCLWIFLRRNYLFTVTSLFDVENGYLASVYSTELCVYEMPFVDLKSYYEFKTGQSFVQSLPTTNAVVDLITDLTTTPTINDNDNPHDVPDNIKSHPIRSKSIPHGTTTCMAMNVRLNVILTGGIFDEIVVWELTQLKKLRVWNPHLGGMCLIQLLFARHENNQDLDLGWMFSLGGDGCIKIWGG